MPFDNPASVRPYMREGTAALAALVATGPTRAVLSLVYAELQHRERPAARRLRDEVAAILSASVSQPVPLPPPPPVLSVPPSDPAPQPAKPARKAKAAKPAPVASVPRSVLPPAAVIIKASVKARRRAEKQAPAMMWGSDIGLISQNPMRDARMAALAAHGWTAEAPRDGRAIYSKGAQRCSVSLVSGGVYYMDGTLWERQSREALTDEGRPILAKRAADEARKVKMAEARAKVRARRREALSYMARWRKAQGTPQAPSYPAEGRADVLKRARRDCREIMAKAAA